MTDNIYDIKKTKHKSQTISQIDAVVKLACSYCLGLKKI